MAKEVASTSSGALGWRGAGDCKDSEVEVGRVGSGAGDGTDRSRGAARAEVRAAAGRGSPREPPTRWRSGCGITTPTPRFACSDGCGRRAGCSTYWRPRGVEALGARPWARQSEPCPNCRSARARRLDHRARNAAEVPRDGLGTVFPASADRRPTRKLRPLPQFLAPWIEEKAAAELDGLHDPR